VFTPRVAELPGPWPACRAGGCGSTAAFARAETRYGPLALSCENGHLRAYRKRDDFRGRGRFAAAAGGIVEEIPRDAPERSLEAGDRRCAEVIEDAERCSVCLTPPADHPYRPDLAARSDRAVWTWLQRWRAAACAQLAEGLAIEKHREPVTYGSWRLKLPPALREIVVRELADSALRAGHVVPLEHLAPMREHLTKRDLAFAVNRLLIPVCLACAERRARARSSREDYLRDYVVTLHGGDQRAARADAAAWKAMERVASLAALVRIAEETRTA
jgi:hypothetical protein